jgi:uncharacterized 2Fe-2S/4Fe-4S cluster protein (DUF4445 family)
MKEYKVLFKPEGKEVHIKEGETILEAANQAGVYINSECGGEGVCGRCKVQVIEGKVDKKSVSMTFLNPDEIQQGYILACQTPIRNDLVISVPSQAALEGEQILKTGTTLSYSSPEKVRKEFTDQREVSYYHPLTRKTFLKLPPPDLNDTLPDQERLFREIKKKEEVANLDISLPCLRNLPTLLRQSNWEITVTSWGGNGTTEIIHVEPGNASMNNYGIALDVGTTTVVAELVNLGTGEVLGVSATHNKQIGYGEDVITRIIFACTKDGMIPLNKAIIENINQLIKQLVNENGIKKEQITGIVAAGNPTMIHLLLGLNPCSIRLEPYIPVSNTYTPIRASDLGIDILPQAVIICTPGVSSYVGGDISAGVLSSGMNNSSHISALLDLGTNGEIALGNNDWLVCCSASAGPAFEGGGLRCGMRATTGAIQKVKIEDSEVKLSVIGETKARGICGSGLIDLMAELFLNNIIDPTGKFHKDSNNPRVRHREEESEFILAFADESDIGKDIVFTETDIGNVIKSKAAVLSAAKVIIESVGMGFQDLDRIFVAGGFGNYLNIERAITIGLLPDIPLDKIQFIGNSSLSGARMGLLSRHALEEAKLIAKKMTYFELSVNPRFMDEFVAAMFLPHTNLNLYPSVKQKDKGNLKASHIAQKDSTTIKAKSDGNASQSSKVPPVQNAKQESVDNHCHELEKEIEELKAKLDDSKAALPMHDATPQQWFAIEELEEKISQKKKELRNLKK